MTDLSTSNTALCIGGYDIPYLLTLTRWASGSGGVGSLCDHVVTVTPPVDVSATSVLLGMGWRTNWSERPRASGRRPSTSKMSTGSRRA